MRVFITGASSGIGAALSRAFAARGDTLGLVARNPDKLASFIKTLPFAEKHVPYAVDVTNRTDLLAAAQDFESQGATDIVIACAGISTSPALAAIPVSMAVFRSSSAHRFLTGEASDYEIYQNK